MIERRNMPLPACAKHWEERRQTGQFSTCGATRRARDNNCVDWSVFNAIDCKVLMGAAAHTDGCRLSWGLRDGRHAVCLTQSFLVNFSLCGSHCHTAVVPTATPPPPVWFFCFKYNTNQGNFAHLKGFCSLFSLYFSYFSFLIFT